MMIVNESKIWQALKQIGFTDFASAGIMANIFVESGFKPDNVQNSFEKRLGTDAEYTKKVNERTYTREQFANDSAGYGLCQWTYHTRKSALYDFCMCRSTKIDNIVDQLLFMTQECRNSGLFDRLNKCTSPYDAGVLFMLNFEKPKDQSVTAQKRRGELAVRFYNDNVDTKSIDNAYFALDNLFSEVTDTLKGKYGNGADRVKALGADYEIVQNIINHIM